MNKNEAKTILLEVELVQAFHMISFLHSCLTRDGYKYAYPEHTEQQLERIARMVAIPEGCIHSVTTKGCDRCVEGNAFRSRVYEAEAVLKNPAVIESEVLQ